MAEVANSSFDNYFDIAGNEISVEGTTASDTTTTDYQSEDIPYLINPNSEESANNFIAKNRARAVMMEDHSDSTRSSNYNTFKKVPTAQIYFREPQGTNGGVLEIDNTNISR